MKKNLLFSLILLTTSLSIFVSGLFAQPSGFIYGLHHQNGNEYFSKIDLANGQLTNMDPLPFVSLFSNKISSFADWDQGIYYYSTGNKIAAFDINSGALLYNVNYSIPSTAYVSGLEYNACDSAIYGVFVSAITGTYLLVKLNPSSGTIATIGIDSLSTYPANGDGYFIDPVNQVYYFSRNNNLWKIDMLSGQVISTTPIINLPGEMILFIRRECATGLIYCTSGSLTTTARYLSTLDPVTGLVSHVSANSFPSYYSMLLLNGGSTLRQTGTYYYEVPDDTIVGVDLLTGTISQVMVVTMGNSYLESLLAYPQCSCTGTTAIPDSEDQLAAVTISFNPVSSLLTVTSNYAGQSDGSIRIINLLGEVFYEEKSFSGNTSVDLQSYAKGMYIVEVISDGKKTVEKLVR
jgi:hypothetical protein